jgi:fructan beta-fructosidase
VLEDPAAGGDFRDPKVCRYRRDDGELCWIMAVAAGGSVRFYRSPDLRDWTYLGSFGDGQPDELGVFECPDLFELTTEGGPERAWVLTVGHLAGGPRVARGPRNFVGSFDGERFRSDDELTAPHWADRGADLDASQTWSDVPGGRRIWAGWVNNWAYADRVPSAGWRGGLPVPRELGLVRDGDELLLTQTPVAELATAREQLLIFEDVTADEAAEVLADVRGLHLDLTLDVEHERRAREPIGLVVAEGGGDGVPIVYDPVRGVVTVDRRRSGAVDSHPGLAAAHEAPYDARGRLQLRGLLDGSSVEVFVGDRRDTITDLIIFPSPTSTGLRLLAGRGAHVHRLEVAELRTEVAQQAP